MKFHSQDMASREADAQEADASLEKQWEWDRYWLGIAVAAARKSKDPSTKVGVVIVRPGNSIVSTGFNGFPRKLKDTPELYADRDKKLPRMIHAEVNAIAFAREPLDGYTLYTTLYPCDKCALQVIQAGITRVVTYQPSAEITARWKDSFDRTRELLTEAGVQTVWHYERA